MKKICIHCEVEKPLADFNKAPKHKYGVGSWCKECKYESDRKRYKEKNRQRDPKKVKARNIIYRAIVKGEINKPTVCSLCGHDGIINGHHRDYNKPLEVIWLCTHCHHNVHLA